MPSKNRAPVWPEGVVGSLTHCAGYRAAAVAWSRTHLSLGIDAEPHLRLPDDVRPLVLAAGDCTGRIEGVHTDRVVFSAKESYYKAWSPVQQTWLDFSDVRVRLAPDGTFEASIVGEVDRGSVPTMALGRWRVVDGLILTSVTWRR